ncbi:MAG: hypothetical protein R3B84_17275 [Zavarzinella sp.]
MATVEEDRQVLGMAGSWRATPEDYSSLRVLWLNEDGSGELVYGYGQTIYACIRCCWDVASPGRLRLNYLESPPYQRFQGYTPTAGASVRELGYTLIKGEVSGVESVVCQPYRYQWTMKLSEPPWPPELLFPYDVPQVFVGHSMAADDSKNEPGDAPESRI